MIILKRLIVLIISLSIVGCSSQHVLKGDIATNKDVNIKVTIGVRVKLNTIVENWEL